jgi:hypothetical protein
MFDVKRSVSRSLNLFIYRGAPVMLQLNIGIGDGGLGVVNGQPLHLACFLAVRNGEREARSE